MKEKFKDIDINNEKVNRIINCALEEFSKNKFEKASTNNIVKAANVSRGLMYHYFTDKQELFDFLTEFSITELINVFNEKFDWKETDILNRLRQSVKIKFDVFMRYPYMLEFYIKTLDKKTINDTQNGVLSLYLELSNLRNKFYTDNIDLSKFKDDVDVEKAINVIRWTIKKFSEEYQDKVRSGDINLNLEILYKEIDIYIEFLRKTFYK